MSYLCNLPVSRLKIDGSFIKILGENETNNSIVKSIVTLAKSLQLMVVGECVITEPQQQLLTELGYDLGQGCPHANPLETDHVEHYVRPLIT